MTNAKDPLNEQADELQRHPSDITSDQDPKSVSDIQKTSADELFDKQELSDSLDLDAEEAEKSRQSLSAKEAKEKQINSWASKIKSGAKKIEDIPQSLSWLRPDIEKQILLEQREPDIELIIERKLQQKDAEQRFADKKARINELDLTKSQQAAVSSEFKSLLADGVPKNKALDIALKVNNIHLDQQEAKTAELFNTMAVRGGRALMEEQPMTPDLDEEKLTSMKSKLPLDKRIEHYENLRKAK